MAKITKRELERLRKRNVPIEERDGMIGIVRDVDGTGKRLWWHKVEG